MKKVLMIAMAFGLVAVCSGFLNFGSGSSQADERPIGPNGERLNRIPGTESIDIPQGISDKQALDVIEATIRGTKAGEGKNYWISQWRMEDRDPANKWIRVGLTARQHYLCVCYRIENGKLVPDVPTSTNLKQDGIKIHRKVPVWINNLKPLISMRFYDLVNGKANPTAPAAPATAPAAAPAAVPATAPAAVPATAPAAAPATETANAFCPSCGKKVGPDANFCGGCGKKLK